MAPAEPPVDLHFLDFWYRHISQYIRYFTFYPPTIEVPVWYRDPIYTQWDLDDSESDGPEIVFYDPSLVTNGIDDINTLTGLGGDGNPDNDSPYNITWSDGVNTYPASGLPVLLIRVTGCVTRAGNIIARKRILVDAYVQEEEEGEEIKRSMHLLAWREVL